MDQSNYSYKLKTENTLTRDSTSKIYELSQKTTPLFPRFNQNHHQSKTVQNNNNPSLIMQGVQRKLSNLSNRSPTPKNTYTNTIVEYESGNETVRLFSGSNTSGSSGSLNTTHVKNEVLSNNSSLNRNYGLGTNSEIIFLKIPFRGFRNSKIQTLSLVIRTNQLALLKFKIKQTT